MNTKEAIERVQTRFNKWALDEEDLTALQALGLVTIESEDERIRKRIIAYLKACTLHKDIVDEFVSYLEKQKEQKPIDIDFVSDWLRKHIKTYVNSEYNEFHKTVEYDGSINIERLIEDLKKAIEQRPFARENNFVSEPAEWSDEDEGMLNCIIATLCEESHGGREANDKMVVWLENRLKILRPQPKQEWSEEDKEMIQDIIDLLDPNIAAPDFHEIEKWLKSLPERFNLPR